MKKYSYFEYTLYHNVEEKQLNVAVYTFSGWSDFLEKSLFPSHTFLLPNIFLELMTFQKANKSISCFKKLSQTCP
ncbi:hypothetical protein Hanom_Chr09g00806171 [Helianthus anomalus]